MNQLKQIFGLSANITNRVPLRGSSITRSAGTSGKDHRRSRDLLVAASDSDDSPEFKISGRSYAKLIADYSKEIEARNVAARLNGDRKAGATRAGFFSGTPFQRLARVSSLVKIKTGRNNPGPGLCTKSSSEPPIGPAKAGDVSARGKGSPDGKNVPGGVTDRAEWLDKVIKAHRAKSEIANGTRSQHDVEQSNMAHPLVQRITKTTPARYSTSNDFVKKISSVKKKTDVPRNDTGNVSVVVEPLKKIDKEKNASMADREEKNAMLVRLTEESKHASTSGSNPLRHIDLRINGKPATELDTVISKVEKLDVVSSAEKIEIRIPVLSEAPTGDKLRAPDSTINVYISSRREESPARRESAGEVARSGDSGSGSSRSGSAHPSTFFIPNVRNFRKDNKSAERSRVVPWWTTEDSFRRSENVPAGSAEKSTMVESPKIEASAIGGMVARDEREASTAKSKEVAVSDSEPRVKPVVTAPGSPRQLSKIRRNGTSAVSKIIANESQKKSERQRQVEQWPRHRLPLGRSRSDATPEAESDTRVKSTASNEPKKEAPSVAVGSTMTGKSVQPRSPRTPDKSPKKMSSPFGVTVAASGGEPGSESNSSMSNDTGRYNNLSSQKYSKGGIHAKPISEIGAEKTKADTHGVTSSGRVSRVTGTDRVGSKVGTKLGPKPLQEVTSESKTNEASRPSESYGNIELLPSTRSPAEPAKQPTNGRGGSIKPNGSALPTVERLPNAKNSAVTMKPIEKKKDGTLIDYGATVTTRKKPERKLSGSRSTNGVQRKKITGQEEPVVVATIKEVIPRRNRDVGGDAFNRNSEEPGSRLNGIQCPTPY